MQVDYDKLKENGITVIDTNEKPTVNEIAEAMYLLFSLGAIKE